MLALRLELEEEWEICIAEVFRDLPTVKLYIPAGLPATLDPVLKLRGNAFADWKAGLMSLL
jgi:hypothetical protein